MKEQSTQAFKKHSKQLKTMHGTSDLLAFTLPALILVSIVMVIPFCMNLYYGFTEWNGVSSNAKFVGFNNYKKILFHDPTFWRDMWFSIKFGLFYVVIVNILSMAAALALYRQNKITTLGRAFLFVPFVISMVAISLIWKFILTSGFQNIYEKTGWALFGLSWLGDPKVAFYAVVLISVWQNIGFYMVIYIAGLINIPTDILEAAKIDGAGAWTTFWKIKLPLLMQSVTICLFCSISFALKLFDIILVLTKGGPANATCSVAYNIYREAFMNYHYGLATAKSIIFFLLCIIITIVQMRITKKREVQL